MRTAKEIKQARHALCEKLRIRGLSNDQRILLMGMLDALVWAAGDECKVMEDLIRGRPIVVHDEA